MTEVGDRMWRSWIDVAERVLDESQVRIYRMRATSPETWGQGGVETGECQKDNVAPSIVKPGAPLADMTRINAYPDTPKGKDSAHNKANELRDQFDGDLQVNARRVYCKDLGDYYWTVWAKEENIIRSGERALAPRFKGEGEYNDAMWKQVRGKAKKTIDCPKCHAPATVPCVSDLELYKEGITKEEVEEIPKDLRKAKRTNPHKERAEAYMEREGIE